MALPYTATMRVMPFIQVLLLLGLLAYLLLVSLENPGLIHLPLPLGRGEWLLSTGAAIGLFLVVGGLYAALLLLPTLLQAQWRRRAGVRARQELEQKLAATLQARLGAMLPQQPESPLEGTKLEN